MKFRLLLFILQQKLSKAAKKNDSFRKFIENKRLRFDIKTADGRKGRRYIFENGKIRSTTKIQDKCDAAMVWKDADTAFNVMSCGDDEASVAALTERSLQVEGNLKEFMWFSRALDIMMGKA